MSASPSGDNAAFIAAMRPVALELLGAPNRKLSSKRELQYGNRGSLKVNLDTGIWHDHEHDVGGGVLALVQDRKRLDKAGAIEWLRDRGHLAASPAPKPEAPRKIVATYAYRDQSGAPQFEVVKFAPKDFRQRRPDGRDGWIWNMRGVEKVLFRLPEVIGAVEAGRTIYIAEGEKAVLALASIGLDATCSPGGANKWRPEYGAPLAAADVVLLPDNDTPGEAHALDVARKLQRIARSIRIVRLPDLPDKGDVWDWIYAGGAAEELEQLASDTPTWGADVKMPNAASDDAGPSEEPPEPTQALRDFLAIEAWADRDMPQPDRLLGDLVTTTSRMFLVGRTGLGKTMLGFGLAVGMASGRGFLHWRSARPARVLVLDGEMPGELIKARSIDALRRAFPPPPGNLTIYARDTEDAFATRFPMLGKMPPLNTEAGQNFVHALIVTLGGVDIVVFDNVMSLIAGDQKDEVPWSDTLPLVSALTAKRIGQVWLDHAGHNTDRQYGSSTKAWRFDAVGVMTPLPDDQRQRHEVAFTLSFEHPGKARRRTPDNWADFETSTIRLRADQWTSEPAAGARSETKLTPVCRQFYRALVDALVSAEPAGRTTRAAWYAQCVRTGLADPVEPDEGYKAKDAKHSKFRMYLIELKSNGLIGVDGETIHDLRRPA